MVEKTLHVNSYCSFQKIVSWLQSINQGAKKVSFTAFHLGKLSPVCSGPQNFLMGSIDYSSSVI